MTSKLQEDIIKQLEKDPVDAAKLYLKLIDNGWTFEEGEFEDYLAHYMSHYIIVFEDGRLHPL